MHKLFGFICITTVLYCNMQSQGLHECVCVCYLSRQQCVGVEALHAGDQLVFGVHHIVNKGPIDQEPIRASVHRNALWDLAVPETPHVGVTFVEESVQTLLTDETEGTHGTRISDDTICPPGDKFTERDRWTVFLSDYCPTKEQLLNWSNPVDFTTAIRANYY